VIPRAVTPLQEAAVHVVRDMEKNHTMAFAAALSYYFVVALFPFLIFRLCTTICKKVQSARLFGK
jgi:uncharacterized BrkB/YihY/UPF0761 family membrane protein